MQVSLAIVYNKQIITGQFLDNFKLQQNRMKSSQMRPELVNMLRNTVEKLDMSMDTYHHAILLFNIIRIRQKQQSTVNPWDCIKIPIITQKFPVSSDKNPLSIMTTQSRTHQSCQRYVQSETSLKQDKIHLTVCLFLAHKLYQPTILKLPQIMTQMQIEQQHYSDIISLEIKFLGLLSFKIQNLLPSNQTIFACHLWDQFIQNIDQTCIDVRFGIKEILDYSKIKIQPKHYKNLPKNQPQFKVLQNLSMFNALSQNIQILVHDQNLYELYLKKSQKYIEDDVQIIKKIGLAIAYVVIIKNTKIEFNKKYFSEYRLNYQGHQKNKYLQYVYNDFLSETYGLKLDDLKQEIQAIYEILDKQEKVKRSISSKQLKDIYLSKKSSKSNKLLKFYLRKGEPLNNQVEDKENLDFNSVKTKKSLVKIRNFGTKDKSKSLSIRKYNVQKPIHLQSTLCESRRSGTTKSFTESEKRRSDGSNYKKYQTKGSILRKSKNSSIITDFSYSKRIPRSKLKLQQTKQRNSAQSYNFQKDHYEVSQFVSIDA